MRGVLIDMPAEKGLREQPTFSRDDEISPGPMAPGRTRIDSILTNRAGWALVKTCSIRWDLLTSDHAPIQIEIDWRKYQSWKLQPQIPKAFPDIKWTK